MNAIDHVQENYLYLRTQIITGMKKQLNYLIGRLIIKSGFLNVCLKISGKLGFLSARKGHDSNGISIEYDLEQDGTIHKIKTVFDVGASIGRTTKQFLDLFPQADIYSFEPYSVSFKTLFDKFDKISRVHPLNLALSENSGKLEMFIQSDPGYNSLKTENNKPSPKNSGYSEQIDVVTLDEFCKKNDIDSVDFLKIDTEGLDLQVLRGGQEMLKNRKVRYVFVECTFDRDNTHNTQFSVLQDYLHEFDFKLRSIHDQSNFGNKKYLTCVNALFALQDFKK